MKPDKHIPIPPRNHDKQKYHFHELKLLESFFFPEGDPAKLGQAAFRYGRNNGMKFTIREVEENGIKGVRVWRVG
jgi:hypothetical protein